MTKIPNSHNQTKDQTKQIILETVKKNRPKTTEQLIKLIQEKTNLTVKEINELLLQLENQNALHFTKEENSLPSTSQTYVSSRKIAWYWLTITLSFLTAITVFFVPDDSRSLVYLRSGLGLVFLLFLPGYTLTKMLFPSITPIKTNIDKMENIERFALSLGASIALVPTIGLILYYSPWGIQLTLITLSLLSLTIVFATIAVLREYQSSTQTVKFSI